MGVTIRVKQVMASILAASAALVGAWASFAPHSFYVDFPWPGRHWVSEVGPYDEHLVRDVGGLYLALLVITVWSVVRGTDEWLRVTGVSWTVFNLLHFAFHADHLDGLTTFDKISQTASLGVLLIVALALAVVPARSGQSV